MKQIHAYVHRDRLADVVAGVKDCAAWDGTRGNRRHNLAAYVVQGLPTSSSDDTRFSMDLGDEVVKEFKLELICEDAEVQEFVDAIKLAARTGQPVGGWITVVDVVLASPIA